MNEAARILLDGTICGVIVTVGVLLIPLILGSAHAASRASRHGIEVTARAAGTREDPRQPDQIYAGGGGEFAALVTFRTLDGEIVSTYSQYVYRRRDLAPPTGTTVPIRYNPADPRDIHIVGTGSMSRLTLSAFMLIPVSIILVGICFLVVAVAVP